MSELDEFKKVVSPIAYGLAYKSELGTTEYQQLYAEEDVIKYFNNKPQLTIPKSIADKLDDIFIIFVRERHSCNIWTLLYRAAEQDYEIGDELEVLLPDENQVNIAIAYIAGKALGVDLVKVVEGINDNY
ncbi:hypothetical protein [Lactococcus cremoris]|uniref:hypothetical protein n=1 Tax=Lactococcus lactis subsp. cremoris TaxID=1359 RepID=UPI0024A6F091|nr:hypothetical protein [Lactococcus cremoris]